MTQSAHSAFDELFRVVAQLRNPQGGCPWDLKQTHPSLLRYLIEESYEYIEAVENQDIEHMREELGDVLLQVLLHSIVAQQNGTFNFEQVCTDLRDKLVRRHPHVFNPDGSVLSTPQTDNLSAEGALKNWQNMKAQEKDQAQKKSLIGPKLLHAQALTSAYNIGKKTAEIKFDWDDANQVAYKVEEEWQELKEEIIPLGKVNKEKAQEELGDFLFSIAQLARHLELDPEEALRMANKKFIRRFGSMENLIEKANKKVENMDQKQMDVYWDQAKKLEREK